MRGVLVQVQPRLVGEGDTPFARNTAFSEATAVLARFSVRVVFLSRPMFVNTVERFGLLLRW